MSFKKLNFWAVFALVVSSQIGSGIFVLPLTLSPYGFYSFFAWIISGLGAISLALVFAKLCASFPKASGLHIYVKETLNLC